MADAENLINFVHKLQSLIFNCWLKCVFLCFLPCYNIKNKLMVTINQSVDSYRMRSKELNSSYDWRMVMASILHPTMFQKVQQQLSQIKVKW